MKTFLKHSLLSVALLVVGGAQAQQSHKVVTEALIAAVAEGAKITDQHNSIKDLQGDQKANALVALQNQTTIDAVLAVTAVKTVVDRRIVAAVPTMINWNTATLTDLTCELGNRTILIGLAKARREWDSTKGYAKGVISTENIVPGLAAVANVAAFGIVAYAAKLLLFGSKKAKKAPAQVALDEIAQPVAKPAEAPAATTPALAQ